MSSRLLLPLLVAFVLVSASVAEAGSDWSLEAYKKMSSHSDWEGYAVGTMIHTRKTGVMNMPGHGEPRKTDEEEKKTLIKITDTELTIKVEKKQPDGTWSSSERTKKRKKDVKFEMKELGTGTVNVEGTDYECKKVLGTKIEGAKRDEVTFWVHPEAGVLKMSMKEGEMTTKRLSVSHKIGDQTVDCREFALKHKMGEMTMMISQEVPGHTVRQSMAFEQGPVSGNSKEEIIAFVKK